MKTYKTIEELLETKKAQTIIEENLSSYNDEDAVIAVLEINYWSRDWWTCDDLENAINDVEKWNVTYWNNWNDYYDYCDDWLCFPKDNEILERYFDYDAFHSDCEYDVTEASNWVIISNW